MGVHARNGWFSKVQELLDVMRERVRTGPCESQYFDKCSAQPRSDFFSRDGRGGPSSSKSEPEIIEVEFEEKRRDTQDVGKDHVGWTLIPRICPVLAPPSLWGCASGGSKRAFHRDADFWLSLLSLTLSIFL
ncbi:hypothetical protein ACFX1X_042800 [Malus domestica]